MNLQIHNFELPPIGTQCYAIINPGTLGVAVFDAPLNAWASAERLCVRNGYHIEGLYLTHGHWDHTLDGWKFAGQGIPVYAHAGDRMFYENPQSMGAFTIPGIELKPVAVTHWVQHADSLQILDSRANVRLVPGHSPGSVLYWFPDASWAISGDAIFKDSIGRTDFPGCSFEQLEHSIRSQIYTLPEATRLFPGHGPDTSVAAEAAHNPFVRRGD